MLMVMVMPKWQKWHLEAGATYLAVAFMDEAIALKE